MKKELMYPVDLKGLIAKDEQGNEYIVLDWLKTVADRLPRTFRYKTGKNAGKIVNHYKELQIKFKEEGRRGVLQYAEKCDKMSRNATNILFSLMQRAQATSATNN